MTGSSPILGRQLALDFPHEPSHAADTFLISNSNTHARTMVEKWPDWPARVVLMVGPAGSGKSHLGAIWAERAAIMTLPPTIVRAGARFDARTILCHAGTDSQAILIEDCDRAGYPEDGLFHLLNLIQDLGGWALVTARSYPDAWNLRTPDLLSRLRLAPVIAIEPPDSALISAILLKLFRDRQIRVDPDTIAYATLHCEQSLDAINDFVAAVDEEALAEGRRITRPLAARTLARLNERKHDA